VRKTALELTLVLHYGPYIPAPKAADLLSFGSLQCRLPVFSVHALLEVSRQTSRKETKDAQEQVHREPDRGDAETG
jgi:hypothetical protein